MRNSSTARGGVAKRPAAHPCSMCTKRFTKRSNLRIHERLHTGERPYVCRFHGCGRSYKWLSSINFHEGRCERRAFGLASATQPSNPNTKLGSATPNSQALPSSPVTPVRGFSNELVLPPATHLKRIAEAPTTNNPRRRHAPMPVSLPPPLPPTSAPILAPAPSHPHHHPHHYQQQQQPPSMLMQMARALPPAPLPLPQFGAQYAHHPLAAPSFGMPTHHSAQLQRLLGGVAPPVPLATPHVSAGLPVDSHPHPQPQNPKNEEEYVQVNTSVPQPNTTRELFHESETAASERARNEEAAGNGATAATSTGGRAQCTVAGGVLDDLTSGNYAFDGEQAHSEVLLF